MCNMLDFMATDTFLQPAINCLVTYSKDLSLLHGVLLGKVRRNILKTERATRMDGSFSIII